MASNGTKIAVLGLWHLGEVYSACLAELGHTVFGVADDAVLVRNFKQGILPVAEPDLGALLRRHQKNGRLTYTTDYEVLKKCDILWVTLDTPVGKRDKAEIGTVSNAVFRTLPYLKGGVLIVVSSQLPVGSSNLLIGKLRRKRPDLLFSYAYVPENLQLGTAVKSFMHPSRVVIGADGKKSARKVQRALRVLKTDFLVMNIASAEMVKHALNAFLATSLSFIYDIADMCEVTGADVTEVSRALKSDPRIGKGAYLDASIGFSGGTLGRDLQFLSAEAKQRGLSLPVIDAVYRKNTRRYLLATEALKKALGNLRDKKVAIVGITYKSGTPTLRRSLALLLAQELSKKGVRLSFADPLAKKKEVAKEMGKTKFAFSRTPLASAKGCHAVIMMTPWKGLESTNFKRLREGMKRPALLFDARNFFAGKRDVVREAGLTYRGVGVKDN